MRTGDPWGEYHRRLSLAGWERKEGSHPKKLIVTRDDDRQKVGLVIRNLVTFEACMEKCSVEHYLNYLNSIDGTVINNHSPAAVLKE